MSDPGHMESGRQGSGALSSDQCQLRRGSGALSHDDMGPQKRQCLPQPGMDYKHHPYQALHPQVLPLRAALPCRHEGHGLRWSGACYAPTAQALLKRRQY